MCAGRFTEELAAWLASGFGLDLAVFGGNAVDAVIGSRCRALGLPDPGDYPRRWRWDNAERLAFLDQLLVGETWLFREWPAFALLGEWLSQRRQEFSAAAPLRVLTLPCATGEEAWSIAAVVHDARLSPGAARIEAMDISPSALRQAAEGRYPRRKLRGQPLTRWAHVLHPVDDTLLRVDDGLRALVRFIEANAMDSGFLLARAPYHIIFCRNMMIYMNGAARDQVCATLGQCLAPEGILFLGNAEQAPAGSGLTRTAGEGAFAWRREDAMPAITRPLAIRKPPALIRAATPPLAVAPRATAIPSAAPPPAPREPLLNGERSGNGEKCGLALPAIRRLADQGHYAEALQELASPAAHQSLDPAVHGLAGVVLGALGRKEEAMARLRQALYLDPSHPESLAHLALLLNETGDAAAAARLRGRLPRMPS